MLCYSKLLISFGTTYIKISFSMKALKPIKFVTGGITEAKQNTTVFETESYDSNDLKGSWYYEQVLVSGYQTFYRDSSVKDGGHYFKTEMHSKWAT